jgi:hypothetical protein
VAYGKDLDSMLSARGHQLWMIGIDSKNKQYIDICGNIEPAAFQAIVDKGFHNTDAGYKTSAHEVMGVTTKADAFLLNTDYFSLDEKKTDPLIVHELAHLLEQLKEPPTATANDDENAEAILKSLDKSVRNLHTKEWALHLAVGARVLLTKDLTPFKTIRSFLEAAIPEYDRDDGVRAKKGW